jgi:hypothetical protein
MQQAGPAILRAHFDQPDGLKFRQSHISSRSVRVMVKASKLPRDNAITTATRALIRAAVLTFRRKSPSGESGTHSRGSGAGSSQAVISLPDFNGTARFRSRSVTCCPIWPGMKLKKTFRSGPTRE